MTTTLTRIRRSPLAARHEALKARWISDVAHWPASYGSAEEEAAAVASAAALNDWGPADKYLLKGPLAAAAANVVAPDLAAGNIAFTDAGGQQIHLLRLADDEALFLLPFGGPAGLPDFLKSVTASLFDLSSGLAALRLAGPNARRILEELCPVSLAESALPNQHVVQAPVANIHTVIARSDLGDIPLLVLLVPRDLAEYAWDALLDNGAAHGLIPVGGKAMESRR
jgi:aminomethyltransferase